MKSNSKTAEIVALARKHSRAAIKTLAAIMKQAGTYIVVNSGCGRFPGPYSVVKRAVLIDADGKHSNAIDYSIKCNGAAASQ